MGAQQTTRWTQDQTVSGWRAIGVFAAAVVAYGIGYYIGIAVMFSINGLDRASDTPWEMATIGLGSLLAGVAAKLVSATGWAPLIAALAIALVALLAGLVIDIGFELGIGIGLLVALGTALTAYSSGRLEAQSRSGW